MFLFLGDGLARGICWETRNEILFFLYVESLHFAQPGRHGSRIKAHASADPETGDATSFRQLEDRDAGYREQFREFKV